VLAAVLLWVSAWGSAFAPNIGLLIFARWIGGLGVGISAMICPLYISEISPAHLRGRLVTTFQFAITVGIMIALFNNYWHRPMGALAGGQGGGGPEASPKWFVVDETWRFMFASELVPGCRVPGPGLPAAREPALAGQGGDFMEGEARRVLQRIFREGYGRGIHLHPRHVAAESTDRKRFIDLLPAALPQDARGRDAACRLRPVQRHQRGVLLRHLAAGGRRVPLGWRLERHGRDRLRST
jgi:MFS family permease